MPDLDTRSRMPDPDGAYRMLVEAQRGLNERESAALNARLVLILMNQIGDTDVFAQAIALAKAAGAASSEQQT